MSQTGDERLMVLVEARITDLERNLKKASGTTGREFGKMRRDSKSATTAMEQDMIRSSNRIREATASIGGSIGSLSKGLGQGLVAGIAAAGVTGVIATMRGVADSVAEVGDQARMAGLSFKAFQEWKYVAEQARIPVDAITDGLKEMQLRADEFAVTGQGSAAEAFKRLGLSPAEVKERLKEPSELMLLLIERTRLLGDTAAGVRVFDELFGGTGGERMVSLLAQGEAGIRDQIKAANDFGRVLDDEVIVKAQEIDRQFNAIAQTVGTVLKSAIVSAIDSLMEFIDGFNKVEAQRRTTLQSTQGDLMKRRAEIGAELQTLGGPATAANRNQNRKRAVLTLEMDKLGADEDRIIAELSRRTEMEGYGAAKDRTWTPPVYTPPPEKGSKGGRAKKPPRDAAAEKAKQEAEAVAELIAELEREQGLITATDAERSISNALRQAGAAATDEQKARITELVTAIDAETKAHERLQEQQEAMKEVASDTLHTIADGIRSGAEAGEILGDVIDNLTQKFLDMAINNVVENAFGGGGGGGAGGGWLSSIFSMFTGGGGGADPWGGMRAKGGSVQSGKLYGVGEKGPELFAPGQSGTIIPNHALGMPAASAAAPNITIGGTSVTIQGDANESTIEEVRAMFKQRDRELPRQVIAAYHDARNRGGIR